VLHQNAKKRPTTDKIPSMGTGMSGREAAYTIERSGFVFQLPPAEVARLKDLPDFELREEPALADEFLRFRAERWAENLADARTAPGPVEVRVDSHQRKTHFYRDGTLLFSADL
jgi:hypothetical protein